MWSPTPGFCPGPCPSTAGTTSTRAPRSSGRRMRFPRLRSALLDGAGPGLLQLATPAFPGARAAGAGDSTGPSRSKAGVRQRVLVTLRTGGYPGTGEPVDRMAVLSSTTVARRWLQAEVLRSPAVTMRAVLVGFLAGVEPVTQPADTRARWHRPDEGQVRQPGEPKVPTTKSDKTVGIACRCEPAAVVHHRGGRRQELAGLYEQLPGVRTGQSPTPGPWSRSTAGRAGPVQDPVHGGEGDLSRSGDLPGRTTACRIRDHRRRQPRVNSRSRHASGIGCSGG